MLRSPARRLEDDCISDPRVVAEAREAAVRDPRPQEDAAEAERCPVNRSEMRAEMIKLVDQALEVCETSSEIASFLAAFVLVYDRWLSVEDERRASEIEQLKAENERVRRDLAAWARK